MCGICGTLATRPGTLVAPAEVEAMCATLRHRGPDDRGLHLDPQARLAMAAVRLSIIDLAGGHQPLSNEDGSVWVAQNGEIYNFRALRAELVARGHDFVTHSDTEVIAHLYEEQGLDFARSLQGMFAIAVWDARRGRLVLVRDRLGIKPLFYAEHDGQLRFASEIKALLAAGLPRRLDPVALHDYLSFDYVPGPNTMFEGISRLQAGHRLIWDGRLTIERYWDLPGSTPPEPIVDDTRALSAQLRTRLDDAVAANMVSDVPVGAFLSGGLDSSLVVALMARQSDRPVQTHSIGFREASYNELPWARRVAAHCGTEHHETIVEPNIEDLIHELVGAFDEPFGDSSAVAAWVLAREAAQHAKVVLSGDGGDEIFGGYVIYQADQLARLYRRLPAALAEQALPALARRIPASDRKMSWDLKLRRFVEHGRADPLAAHGSWRIIFTEAMKARLYGAHFRPAGHDSLDLLRAHFDRTQGDDLLNRFMAVDARISLVDDMLTKVDRTSMAHSLEVRVPLLDHHLVEWMERIPSRYKVHGPRMTLKYLMKEAARGLLPDAVIDRPKAGFHVPVPAWLKRELRPLVDHQLGAETLTRQGIFDPAYVAELIAADRAGKANHSRNIWGLLMFGLWYDRFIERTPV
ncbi:MAG: asparagine synthase (glutamine-hydrolyzing) [Chloroflexi bacterium]|nr:asparagine synthase (glutamine-hydrolyzing) [Chloroflexota bacterium]